MNPLPPHQSASGVGRQCGGDGNHLLPAAAGPARPQAGSQCHGDQAADPTTPARTPNPMDSAATRRLSCALSASDSASAQARAITSSGTQMPSLSPLSTLSACRIRDGRRSSETTACPSAASVGARITASTTASASRSSGSTPQGADCPGHDGQREPDSEEAYRKRRLLAQRRPGCEMHRRTGRAPRSARPELRRSCWWQVGRAGRSPLGPTRRPPRRKNIAAETTEVASRRLTSA